MKKVALHNLGCKVNAYETEAMKQRLEDAGYEIVGFEQEADVYIINTCTVTNIADRKSRQMIHKARKQNEHAVIVAAGCYVQASKESKDLKDIDIIIGNNKKQDIVSLIEKHQVDNMQTSAVIDINAETLYEDIPIQKLQNHSRAYVKIQDGCNQFCAYCIIPLVRGRVRSRSIFSILEEVQTLSQKGYQEIVLTGIHLSSYGSDNLDEDMTLSNLLKKIHEIDGIQRIRLSSLEPRVITEEFVQTIVKLPKICPHFHLSLQSGCNTVLKRMNRKYTKEQFKESCDRLRAIYQRPAITTDIIVGFPGETEDEFIETMEFAEAIGFFEMHVFKYSKREGTKAAVMPDQISGEMKNERSSQLLCLNQKMSEEYRQMFVGEQHTILIEETMEINGILYQFGYTKEYVKAAVKGSKAKSGEMVLVKITALFGNDMVLGELL